MIKSLTNFLFVCQEFVLRSALLKVLATSTCMQSHLAKWQSACLHAFDISLFWRTLYYTYVVLVPLLRVAEASSRMASTKLAALALSSSWSVLTESNRPCPFLFFIFCLRIQDQLFDQPHHSVEEYSTFITSNNRALCRLSAPSGSRRSRIISLSPVPPPSPFLCQVVLPISFLVLFF